MDEVTGAQLIAESLKAQVGTLQQQLKKKCVKVQVGSIPTLYIQCQHAQLNITMFVCVLFCIFDVWTCRKSSTCSGSLGFLLLK